MRAVKGHHRTKESPSATDRDEVERLRGQLRRAQALASLGTAAAMLAHEFKNLMTPIVGYAHYALDSGDPEMMSKALERTLTHAGRASEFSERILGLAGGHPVEWTTVSVRELATEALACLCRDLSKDGITVTNDIDSSIKVRADAVLLRQVFFNLLINAREALEGRVGSIALRAARSRQGTVRITVSDTGCGIPRDRLRSIFDAFVTSKGVRDGEGRGGTGLGLAVCRDIVEEHEGHIQVRSRPGEGASFTITLPASG